MRLVSLHKVNLWIAEIYASWILYLYPFANRIRKSEIIISEIIQQGLFSKVSPQRYEWVRRSQNKLMLFIYNVCMSKSCALHFTQVNRVLEVQFWLLQFNTIRNLNQLKSFTLVCPSSKRLTAMQIEKSEL